MEVFDVIYDKDALISGIVLAKRQEGFYVLWANDSIGLVEENDETITVERKGFQGYIIEDILHSGYSGVRYEPKVGKKYDFRRNRLIFFSVDFIKDSDIPTFDLYDLDDIKNALTTESKSKNVYCYQLKTTPFKDFYEEDGYFYLRTMNSIYKLKKAEF